MKPFTGRIATECFRLALMLLVVSFASSWLAIWIAESTFVGFFENLHIDRDGLPIWNRFFNAALQSIPILGVSVLMLATAGMVLGYLAERNHFGWIKLPVLMISACPSFLFPFLPSALLAGWQFEGLSDGGVWIPALCLSIGDCNLSAVTAHFRESLRTQAAQPHVITIEALGMSARKHVLVRSSVTLLSSLAGRIPHMIGGLVALEMLYNIAGLGITSYQSLSTAPADLHWLFWTCVACVIVRTVLSWLEQLARWIWMPDTLGRPTEIDSLSDEVPLVEGLDSVASSPEEESLVSQVHSEEVNLSDNTGGDAPLKAPVMDSSAWGTSTSEFAAPPGRIRSLIHRVQYYVRVRPANWVAVVVAPACILVFTGILLACFDYGDVEDTGSFLDPSDQHWFGTDLAGVDLLSAMYRGAWQMTVPLAIALVASLAGVPCALLGLFPWIRNRKARNIARFLDQFFLLVSECIESLPKLLVLLACFSVMSGQVIDGQWFGMSWSIHTMVIRLFAVIGILHAPQVYRAVRDELNHVNRPQFFEATLLRRQSTRELVGTTILRNHCVHVVLIQCAVVTAGVLQFDAALGLLGVRGRGVVFTWGSQLGMGVEAYMNYAPLDWFNSWVMLLPLTFVWLGIVSFWFIAESFKTVMGGYVYRLR